MTDTTSEPWALEPEIQHAIEEAVAIFIKEEAKERLIASMPPTDVTALGTAIELFSGSTPGLIAKHKSTPEFRRAYDLFGQSRRARRILPELHQFFGERVQHLIVELERQRDALFTRILGAQATNYRAVVGSNRPDKHEIASSMIDGATRRSGAKHSVKQLAELDRDLANLKNHIAQTLNDNMLRVLLKDSDILEDYALVVAQPKYLTLFPWYDDDWARFPFRWCARDMPVPAVLELFERFKCGEDISPTVLDEYDEDGLAELQGALASPFLRPPFHDGISSRHDLILETLDYYRSKKYGATVTAALPLIEGILWEHAAWTSRRRQCLFAGPGSKKLIDAQNCGEISNPTIGDLLKKTAFARLFDAAFIEYFCDELYAERNPVLHGRTTDYGSQLNAAKKIETLAYVLDTIKKDVASLFLPAFKNFLTPEQTERFVAHALGGGSLSFEW